MRTLTDRAIVTPEHTLTLQVPSDIPPGPHEVVVVLQDGPLSTPQKFDFSNWPAHPVGPADPKMTYRREDIYGDDGR